MTAPGPLELGPTDDSFEREAESFAQVASRTDDRDTQAAPNASDRATRSDPMVRRSFLGGILGGIGGAVAGAVTGFLVGGPIGAVLGGIGGLVGGALIGDAATTEKRGLTSNEISYAHEIYLDSIDYSVISITRDSLLSAGAPKTIGNTIHLRSDWGHFKGDTMELTELGMQTLIHEMGHVWQYQNGGLAYIAESVWVQLKAFVSGGDRGGAYDWHEAIKEGLPWEKWNPEQQAQAIEDYNIALRRIKDGPATRDDFTRGIALLPVCRKGATAGRSPDVWFPSRSEGSSRMRKGAESRRRSD